MLSYVFMKILERRPDRFDQRMNKASRGHVAEIKKALAAEIPAGTRVLEIGCGTAELGAMLAARGAHVDGFDLNPAMVDAASERISRFGPEDRLTAGCMGVESMDTIASETYGAVTPTLVMSELSLDERRFALVHAFRVLKAGGLPVIADEVVAETFGRRFLQSLVRLPLLATAYLVSRSYTRPLADMEAEVRAAGFSVLNEQRSLGETFEILVAKRPEKD